MQSFPYILCLIIAYSIFWFKGNARIVFDMHLTPFRWWLYTSLITNYLMLWSWWHLVARYKIWGAMAITYCLHAIIELSLNSYFYSPPAMKQIAGIFLLLSGTYLIMR